jgi:hypothetical protein
MSKIQLPWRQDNEYSLIDVVVMFIDDDEPISIFMAADYGQTGLARLDFLDASKR